MKVLVADDDRVLSHLLCSRLRAKGWTVDVAFDAMQALMFAMRSVPDVVVLDIHMPGGTGVEALRKLKASVKTSQIPVVVLSGSVDDQEVAHVMEIGAAEFLQKPVDMDALFDAIGRATGV